MRQYVYATREMGWSNAGEDPEYKERGEVFELDRGRQLNAQRVLDLGYIEKLTARTKLSDLPFCDCSGTIRRFAAEQYLNMHRFGRYHVGSDAYEMEARTRQERPVAAEKLLIASPVRDGRVITI